jgi:hypothetical protein
MKKLLPVMAVVLCACLTMGFKAPAKNTTHSTNAAKLRPAAAKWRNTTWVNPMATAKQLPIEFKFGSGHVIIHNKNFYSDYLISATFSQNYFPTDVSATNTFSYYWPDTSWRLEFNMVVDPAWYCYVTITERDYNAGTPAHVIYYTQDYNTANYVWYAKQAHIYEIDFEW